MLRVFVTSSQVCTLYMSAYAAETTTNDTIDILLIDRTKKKTALRDLIKQAAGIHKWHEVIDLSEEIDNTQNLHPSFRKRLTRQLKSKKIIKPFYDILLRGFQKKLKSKNVSILGGILHKYQSKSDAVSLFLLTQTMLNEALLAYFPRAEVNYMEHGIGDYFYVDSPSILKGNFICVFNDSFTTYRNKHKLPTLSISSVLSKESYIKFSGSIAEPLKHYLNPVIDSDKKCVLILMDNSEIFNPVASFWTDFLDVCLSKVQSPNNYNWIIKPHPAQSQEALALTKDHFAKVGVNYFMLDKPEIAISAVELTYFLLKDKITDVFSTYSSALFYMSHFYAKNSRFYCLYDFVVPYFDKAPAQYKEALFGFESLINEVFSEDCIRVGKGGVIINSNHHQQ